MKRHFSVMVVCTAALTVLGFSLEAFAASTGGPSASTAAKIHLGTAPKGGSVVQISSPKDFTATRSLGVRRPSVEFPKYYVVQGIAQPDGLWSYPYQSYGPPNITVMEVEISVNDENHTALFEQGIASPSLIAEMVDTLSGGRTASSTVPEQSRPSGH